MKWSGTSGQRKFFKYVCVPILGLCLLELGVTVFGVLHVRQEFETLVSEGLSLEKSRLYVRAADCLQRALDLREQRWPARDANLSDHLHYLGRCYAHIATSGDSSQFAVADRFLRDALSLAEELFGPESIRVRRTASELAWMYMGWSDESQDPERRTARLGEAERFMERAMIAQAALGGPGTVRHGQLLINLGSIYSRQGRTEEAADLYKEAIQIFDGKIDSEDPDAVLASNSYAEMLRRLQQEEHDVNRN